MFWARLSWHVGRQITGGPRTGDERHHQPGAPCPSPPPAEMCHSPDPTGSLPSSTRQNGLQRPRTAGECNISRNHPRNSRVLAEATALHVGARILAKDPSVRQRRPRGSVFGAAFCLRLLRFCRDRCMAVPGRIGLAPTTGSSCPSSRSSAKQTINHPCRATWLGVIIVQ